MTENHPITPPPELVEEWANASARTHRENGTYAQHEFALATQAARWGADTELNECCHLLRQQGFDVIEDLRAARRPKPPCLAEDALEALEVEEDSMPVRSLKRAQRFALIRAALERLKELEQLSDDQG